MERFMTKRELMNGTGNKYSPGICINGHYIYPRYILSATSEEDLKPRIFYQTYDTIEPADPE